LSRQWTVLPATMGLTEFHSGKGPQVGLPATAAPSKLGNYVLEERLGTGGMGDVYRARHSQFGRVRAVKVIRQHFVDAGHTEVIRRFYQEIKAVGALEHPNIVVAIDSSAPTDSVHYLVMEYIDGVGADELVARHGALRVAEACEIARQAARGLAYIHQNGMVHRDIKPSNLMLTLVSQAELDSDAKPQAAGDNQQAVVKILDLGLALLVGDDHQRLTLFDHRAMGTAMYMSPEQWKTTSVDIRADIYSLGCTLYHLLAGKPPFWESDLKPEKAHERERLPPIRDRDGARDPIPRPLWDVLKRMTAKDPNDRFGEPAEVVAALAPFVEGHRLADLVEHAMNAAGAPTEGFAKTETLVAKSSESDTRPGRTPVSWGLPKTLPPASRKKLWRAVTGLVTLAAVAAIGWLAFEATGRRESAQVAIKARGHALQVAAGFAASEILKEINLRFDILNRLAAEDELRQLMNPILREPNNEKLWTHLENWLGARKADYDRQAPADSWFINDVRGIQVARSPRSEASRGANYAHRDYFHGQGADLEENAPNLKPLTGPHLSAVYRSTSSGHLKVAFSVPIENGLSGKDRGIVGVLAMSVDLGEFNVLEKQLPPGQEVVLVDLRESNIDGAVGRGLVLHHQAHAPVRRGDPPQWVSGELLARMDEQLDRAESDLAEPGNLLMEYRDAALTTGKLYWGALKRVVDRRSDEQEIDTRWLVIVQEPAMR
jgi:serine/threonine protein kinase